GGLEDRAQMLMLPHPVVKFIDQAGNEGLIDTDGGGLFTDFLPGGGSVFGTHAGIISHCTWLCHATVSRTLLPYRSGLSDSVRIRRIRHVRRTLFATAHLVSLFREP